MAWKYSRLIRVTSYYCRQGHYRLCPKGDRRWMSDQRHVESILNDIRSNTVDLIPQILDTNVKSPEIRRSIIEKVKNEKSRELYSSIYTHIMIDMLMKNEPVREIIQFQKSAYSPEIDCSTEPFASIFKVGSITDEDGLNKVIRLLSTFSHASLKDLPNMLFPWWIEMQVEADSVMPLVIELFKAGVYPSTKDSLDAFERLLRMQTVHESKLLAEQLLTAFTLTLKESKQDVSIATLDQLLRPIGKRITKIRSLDPLVATLELRPLSPAFWDKFWQVVIRNFTTVPLLGLKKYIQSKGYNIQASALVQLACRTKKVKHFEAIMKTLIETNTRIPPKVFAHHLYLVSRENPRQGEALLQRLKKLDHGIGDFPNVANAYMHALKSLGLNLPAAKFHEKCVADGTDTPQTWNMCLTVLSRSDRIPNARRILDTMLEKNIHIRGDALLEYAAGYISRGRKDTALHEKNISRPLHTVKRLLPNQHKSYSWDEFYCEMEKLKRHGYLLDTLHLSRFFNRLEMLKAIDYPAFTRLIRYLASWTESANGQKRLFFDNATMYRIVVMGYKMNPKCPWVVASFLHSLKEEGVDVPSRPVMEAFTDMIGAIYSPTTARGITKRLRDQVDKELQMDQVIEQINRAWKGN
ncbi:hypothetical protein TRVA0_072S00232 [Trichomonascus vanleenenianus]|uniref:uncharacterized protein n=1 Tax=Trichomonascus vanleenenianus TaxID=2268995 RepID=UPI003ECB9826